MYTTVKYIFNMGIIENIDMVFTEYLRLL
jgi:hypothetical protein